MSPRKSPRATAIAAGIYPDAGGYEVRATAAGKTKGTRFGAGTPLREMTTWQEEKRVALRKEAKTIAGALKKGTLAGDIAAHVANLPARQRKTTIADYAAWLVPSLKDRPRAKITLDHLRAVVRGWLEAGIAASTINHRRRALVKVYEHVDGNAVPVLPRRLPRQREPEPAPRAADMTLLDAIIAGMPDRPYATDRMKPNKAKARLRFMLWTATPPSQMKLMGPHSVNLARREFTRPARLKGRGAASVTLPLVEPQGVEAARAWLRAHAWGPFNASSLGQRFTAAVKAYKRAEEAAGRTPAIPPGLCLYDLRHSFLTWFALQTITDANPGGNPLAVQAYGQHADLATTRRYMLAAVPLMVRAALRVPQGVPQKHASSRSSR